MRANDQFYLIDYLDKLDMEIDLYWERQEDLDEPIGLRGLILDIVTAPDVKTYTEFEWWVCNGVCLFASQGANIYGAAAFFALLVTVVLWTCGWLMGLLLKNIFKRTL